VTECLPDGFVVEDGAFATDGGSIALHVRDSEGSEHDILLQQHMFLEQEDPVRIPGRLYYDRVLVPVRSEMESRILIALRKASLKSGNPMRAEERYGSNPGMIIGDDIKEYMSKIDEGPGVALAHLVRELIAYVESSEYEELARRLNND